MLKKQNALSDQVTRLLQSVIRQRHFDPVYKIGNFCVHAWKARISAAVAPRYYTFENSVTNRRTSRISLR